MADIFLSYAREDRQRVLPLVRTLEERGWSVWWDRDAMLPGKSIEESIEEALETARCVIVAWSQASIRSYWVRDEAHEGREQRILIPVLLDDIRPPLGFRQFHTARLVDWRAGESHQEFDQVVQAVTALVGPPQKSTPVSIPDQERPQPEIRDRLGMEFVRIPAGTFQMGSNDGSDDERPVHQVTISQPFDLGKYPVTQAQWEAVMGDNPSAFTGDPTRPVEKVSWEDVQRFIEQLNARDHTAGVTYRLPTEAEWEYAARAGTTTAYSFGDDPAQLDAYAWYDDNSGDTTHPVGQKQPNPWGLYDMHGNVWEWVQDWYGTYPAEAVTDPQGPDTGSDRVFRGGGWTYGAGDCRSAYRGNAVPGDRGFILGFRLLRQVR
jgi:formylglycine-generating enzyme required for sulfatase activity